MAGNELAASILQLLSSLPTPTGDSRKRQTSSVTRKGTRGKDERRAGNPSITGEKQALAGLSSRQNPSEERIMQFEGGTDPGSPGNTKLDEA